MAARRGAHLKQYGKTRRKTKDGDKEITTINLCKEIYIVIILLIMYYCTKCINTCYILSQGNIPENPEGTRSKLAILLLLVLTNHLISQFKVRIELERWFSNQIGKLEPKDCYIWIDSFTRFSA
jgi:hypothetical protein